MKDASLVHTELGLLLRLVHKDSILVPAYVDPHSFSLSAWNCLENISLNRGIQLAARNPEWESEKQTYFEW